MTSIRSAGAAQAAAVPEPALRPVAARFPDRYATRRARVYVDHGASGTAIVIRDPRGRLRRIPAGPGGATQVVLEPPSSGGTLLGSLALLGEDGQVIARLPRDYWAPESWTDESVHSAGQVPDDAAAFAAATGLPVTDNRPVAGERHHGRPAGRGGAPHPGPSERGARGKRGESKRGETVWYPGTLPPAFLAARALLAVVAAGVIIFIDFKASVGSAPGAQSFAATGTYQALALTGAAAALAQPLLAGVLIARAWWLDRASGRALPEPDATLAPHPSSAVSRRFLRTASLRTYAADLVATEEDGTERWLPRSGPTAVTELARVTVRGKPDRLELRTADGQPRAVLPWKDWFAGPGGEQALAAFAASAGLPLAEAEGKHIPEGEETIWPYRPLRFTSASAAQRYLRWVGLPGGASVGLPVILGILSAIAGAASPAAIAIGLAAIVVSAGPWYARRLARRRLDRTVQPGEAP